MKVEVTEELYGRMVKALVLAFAYHSLPTATYTLLSNQEPDELLELIEGNEDWPMLKRILDAIIEELQK
jgi:hypothetical protein